MTAPLPAAPRAPWAGRLPPQAAHSAGRAARPGPSRRLRRLRTRRDHPPTAGLAVGTFCVCRPHFFPASWGARKLRPFPHAPAMTRAVPSAGGDMGPPRARPGARLSCGRTSAILWGAPPGASCSASVATAKCAPQNGYSSDTATPSARAASLVTRWVLFLKPREWEGSGTVFFPNFQTKLHGESSPSPPVHSGHCAPFLWRTVSAPRTPRSCLSCLPRNQHVTTYSSMCLHGLFSRSNLQ